MSSNNSEINSQEYVELCEQLKTMNEKREREVIEIKQQLLTYKKFAITCYGLSRIIAGLIEEAVSVIPLEVFVLNLLMKIYYLLLRIIINFYLVNFFKNKILRINIYY